jgi:hypothetical protein
MAARLLSMEDRLLLPLSSGPPPSQRPYDMPGYGGLPSAPPTSATIIHTAPSTCPLPIHSIPFPHSPSPLPFQTSSPSHHAPHDDDEEGTAVPCYYKLSFPMYDGKEDSLGWLNLRAFLQGVAHSRRRQGVARLVPHDRAGAALVLHVGARRR